jgi:hypothetical protein
MYMHADKPLLTFAQMRDWQARADRLAEDIRVKTAELVALTRTVDAAKAYIASLPNDEQISFENGDADAAPDMPPDKHDDHDATPGAAEESISGCILAAVAAIGGAPKPTVIRRWIAKNSPAADLKLTAQPAYIYTVLMRHVRAGRLAKRGKGYRLPTSSPKGEAGGVAPPAVPSFTDNDTGTVASGAEAGGT